MKLRINMVHFCSVVSLVCQLLKLVFGFGLEAQRDNSPQLVQYKGLLFKCLINYIIFSIELLYCRIEIQSREMILFPPPSLQKTVCLSRYPPK